MDNLIGKKLDSCYEILELIGSGGMANVYKAMDLRNNMVVAVKVLRTEFMNDKELVRRFQNESKAISLLNHENIVKVYDVSVTDELQFIVMEFIDGINLRTYLNQREGELTWRETVHFIGQVLDALQHAHENGVVHRDVKPQNIMMLPNGALKMMDFGIARIARAENQLMSTKAMGSVHYISPEQAKGEDTDAKSDIYSVGVMMYEMLSGKLPFANGTVVEVAIQQISDDPTPLAEVAPETPYALVEITERAMAKEPEDRYASVVEMREAIAEFKQDPDISFEYKYMTERATSKVIDKVMNKNKRPQTGETKPDAKAKAKAKPKTKKSAKSRKKRKNFFLPILFGITLAFAIACAVLCKMILENSSNPLFSERVDVDLKDYVGLTVAEVKKTDQYKQIDVTFEEEYNSNVAEGLVYKQSPASGRTVKEGQDVTLTVSLGTKYVNLDDYTNMAQEDAKERITSQGVNVLVLYEVNSSVAVGSVIRSEPEAYTTISAGETVYLYVSTTQVITTTTMPDLLNLTLEDGIKLLNQKKISVSTTTESYSASPAGTIIGQAIAPGTEVRINSRVAITVSKGAEPPPPPTPTPSPSPSPSPSPTPDGATPEPPTDPVVPTNPVDPPAPVDPTPTPAPAETPAPVEPTTPQEPATPPGDGTPPTA